MSSEAFAFDQSKLIKSLKITHQALKGIQGKIWKEKKCLQVPPDLDYVRNNNFISIRTCKQEVPENILVVPIHAKNRRSLRQTMLDPPVGRTVDQYWLALGKRSWPLNCVENRA